MNFVKLSKNLITMQFGGWDEDFYEAPDGIDVRLIRNQ